MFRRLKEFHRRTMEEYRRGLEDMMPEWKKKVMRIHEKASFLFYMDTLIPENQEGLCTVRGELVKNQGGLHKGILFLDGEGEELALAILKSAPTEQEESGKNPGKKRKNEFQVQLMTLCGQEMSSLSKEDYNRLLTKLIVSGSLLTENRIFVQD